MSGEPNWRDLADGVVNNDERILIYRQKRIPYKWDSDGHVVAVSFPNRQERRRTTFGRTRNTQY